jgi:hypothetical protein
MLLDIGLGLRMAGFGLILGGLCWLTTRPGSRRSTGPYGRGQDRAAKFFAIPLLLVGAVGLVLWALGH